MRKLIAFIMAAVLILALAACAAPAPPAPATPTTPATPAAPEAPAEGSTDTWNLRLGAIWPEDSPFAAGANLFAERAYELSDGRIQIDIFLNSVLGDQPTMLSGMPLGTVDMMVGDVSTIGNLEAASMFNIFSVPFMWESFDELDAFLNTDTVAEWKDEVAAATGVRMMVAQGEADSRQLTSNRPIRHADDIQGLVIRTAQIALTQRVWRQLGAEPTVMPLADVYMALRLGTAEAQENGFIGTRNNSFHEVQRYVMRINYSRDAYAFYIAERIWSAMNEYDRAIMLQAGSEGALEAERVTAETVEEALAYLLQYMEYIPVDVDSIRDRLGDSIAEFDGDLWPAGVYQTVRDFQAQWRP